ncbi:hypothetical protein GW17_00056394 [Ensete ventricosum]|nr:hypothetical protein GW17_00056394 [Ensete ventricosum]
MNRVTDVDAESTHRYRNARLHVLADRDVDTVGSVVSRVGASAAPHVFGGLAETREPSAPYRDSKCFGTRH